MSGARTRRLLRHVLALASDGSGVFAGVLGPRQPGERRSDSATSRASFASRPAVDSYPPACPQQGMGRWPGDDGVRGVGTSALPWQGEGVLGSACLVLAGLA